MKITMSLIFRALALFSVTTFLVSCATSPTGRSQLILFPSGQMNQMGIAAFSDMKSKGKVAQEGRVSQYVSCVANHLTSVLPSGYGKKWEVVVFDDQTPNAFALPGGKIGVHTGLLAIADTQDQLASVIGHEIGHGFDDSGSTFDGDGVLRNWWTEEDKERFKERTGLLVAQYDGFKVFDDLNVNGELTLGENIGDLSGVTIAYKAYKASLNGKEAPVIDGLTGD